MVVDMQAVSQAALSLFCVSCGVGTVVTLVRDVTIQRQKKQIKELNDRLDEITLKRCDEAFEYADLVFDISRKTEEEFNKKDARINELEAEVKNLRHRNKQLERGAQAK